MSDNATPVIHTYTEEFERFLQNHGQVFKNKEDKQFLREVFAFAADAHKNMQRYSGAPYISHPLEVAKIVKQRIGLGKTSVAAALLHDVPNKTEYTTDDIERFFGKKVAGLVKGLTKIKNTEYFANNQEASVFREILLSMSEDIRVVFIKIADKLHSMRTVEYLSLRKQDRTVREVLNIYAPLAHRLGLFEIKSEMEDLCLKQMHPGTYEKITKTVKSSEREKLQLINRFLIPVKEKLDEANIEYRIQSRAKSIYSIWKKTKQKGVRLDEIYDLFAVRIIYQARKRKEERIKALKIAEMIRDLYPEKNDRTRDWLEQPRQTGYRAYHITVKSNENVWVEVQIRSEEMHTAAEHGLAAHWRYKGLKDHKTKLDEKIAEIINNLKREDVSAENFMDDLKLNLFTTEIYVFTPKGQVISLPKHATVLDFAFKIHSRLAASALSAKVNGEVVPLSAELYGGDRVEIISSEKVTAKKEWFNFITTHKALNGLKNLFKEDRKVHQEAGREQLESIFEEENVFDMTTATRILTEKFRYNSLADFYIDLSENRISRDTLLKTIHLHCIGARSRFWTVKLPDKDFKTRNNGFGTVELASCCRPAPEDPIIGVYHENHTFLIHKKDCPNLKSTKKRKTTTAAWASYLSVAFRKELVIRGRNNKSFPVKLAQFLAESLSVSLKSMECTSEKTGFRVHLKLFVKNDKAFRDLTDKISGIEEVTNIHIGSETINF